MSLYLDFVEAPTAMKTKRWNVWSQSHGSIILGTIQWFPRWRQYAFFPGVQTLFNHECLTEIAGFLVAHAKDRNQDAD